MNVRTSTRSNGLSRRQIELRLIVLCLVIVGVGISLTVSGKLASTYPLLRGSVDINKANATDLGSALEIDRATSLKLIDYRNSQKSRQFASTFRLRRAPALVGVAINWNWQQLYVRTPADVISRCFVYTLLLFGVVLFSHGILRRVAPEADPFLLPIIFLLSGIGLMVSITVHDPLRDTFAFTTQAAGVACFGPIAFLVPLTARFRKLPLHRYTYFYAACAVLLLISLFIFGRGPAATHIELLGFEPIELIKVFLIFFIAAYLAERRMSQGDKLGPRSYMPAMRDVLPLLAIYVFALSLFGAVKDLGPAVLLFGSFVAMLYLVTGKWIYPGAGIVLLLVAGYIGDKLGIGFFASRVEMWLHPWNNNDRLGGQLAQGLWGLSTGGIFGSGSGLGGSYFVPRGGSDMAFTTIGEELGLIGALAVLVLYVVLIYRGFEIAKKSFDDFDRLLAAGITVLIGLQALVITGGDTGLMPLTGITLPFVSYGTSSLVASFFCMGILVNLSDKPKHRPEVAVVSPVYLKCSKRIAMVLAAGLLLLVGDGQLVWFQGVDDVRTATRQLLIPDADHVYRIHRNPRLVAYAAAIPRGSIRDRNGTLLASNAPVGQGVTFLTGGVPRYYPLGAAAGSIVLAAEQEKSDLNPLGSDESLRGYHSVESLLHFYRSKDLPFSTTPVGNDVTLTIDIGLQKIAQQSLTEAEALYGAQRGACVVLNARSGQVLAAATSPTFDPNALTASSWDDLHAMKDPAQPLLNRALAGTYTPGSVFKLVTATAAFDESKSGLVFSCDHTLPRIKWEFNGHRYERSRIVDDEDFARHGTVNLTKAITVSCNVYFAQLGVALGAESLDGAIHEYGLHECPSLQSLGADLPDCAYGQGTDQVTPFQMAIVSQTIANDGLLVPPTFSMNSSPSALPHRVLLKADALQLKEMMADVVDHGTAAGAFPGLSVAGKTGSAQLVSGKPHSWFVGFAPAVEPSIAFACIVEHGGHGRGAAAAVCRSVVSAALK